MSGDNWPNQKRKLLVTSALIGVIAVAYGLTVNGLTNSQTFANEPERQFFRAPAYRLEADAPLNGPDGAVQVITVARGASVNVPVDIIGAAPAGNENMPVALVAKVDAKLGDDGAPDRSVDVDSLQGLAAQFTAGTAHVNAGDVKRADLSINVSALVPAGTYVMQLRGISQEYNVGTVIYLKVI